MAQGSLSETLAGLIAPLVQREELDLVEVEYKHEDGSWRLRIFIDKKNGVTLEDCRRVSVQVDALPELDALLSSSYVLEVSSPGLDRPLKTAKDFLRHQGKEAKVYTCAPVLGKREFHGIIQHAGEGGVTLLVKGVEMLIPLDKIAKAKLKIRFQ